MARILISTPDAICVVEAEGPINTRSVGEVRVDDLRSWDLIPTTEFGSLEWEAFWERMNARKGVSA